MKKMLLTFALSLLIGAMPVCAEAHGCAKGAVLGGIAGHLAGHHGVAGAAIGCAVGHHRAKVDEQEAEWARAATQARPVQPTPKRGLAPS
jgi:hypothetical protein